MSALEVRTLERARSYLGQLRSLGPVPDVVSRFHAVELDVARHVPLEVTAAITLEGQALVACERPAPGGAPRMVVDARWFTDLDTVDATRLAAGERRAVGRWLGGERLSPRALLWLLLEAEVVRTYAHLEAEVALLAEQTEAGGYRARLSATHVYYTSKRHERTVAFSFELAPDGGLGCSGADTAPSR